MSITGYGIYDELLDSVTVEFSTKNQALDYMHELIVNEESGGYRVVEIRSFLIVNEDSGGNRVVEIRSGEESI